jgi:c-di-GMP-binding flagellar brake protein YcgR
MGAWLSKVMHAILADPYEAVRQTLHAAQDDRVKLTLELLSGGQPSVMSSIIEQVRSDDFVISQPMVGGHTYPLAFDEQVRFNFTVSRVTYTGTSRCMGRVKIASGAGAGGGSRSDALIFAYRLALPKALESDDQRKQPRVQLEVEYQAEAQLYAPDSMSGPLLGRLTDVSMSGARVVTAMPVMFMFPGQSLFLKSMMGEPVGLIDELVEIARIETDPKSGETSIGIRFRRKIDGLAELIRSRT